MPLQDLGPLYAVGMQEPPFLQGSHSLKELNWSFQAVAHGAGVAPAIVVRRPHAQAHLGLQGLSPTYIRVKPSSHSVC